MKYWIVPGKDHIGWNGWRDVELYVYDEIVFQ